VYARVPVGH